MIRKLFTLTLFFLFIVTSISAQDLGDINFSQVRVNELSDAQIRQVYERAQQEGMSIADVERVAIARGMSTAEASRLRSRLNQVRVQQDTATDRPDITTERDVIDTDRAPQPAEPERPPRDQRIFGMELFTTVSPTFEPSMNIPTPVDYELGPEDQIVIDIWGAAEQTYQLTVNPEGNIRIANLGPIYVNGLTIEDASERIKNRLSNIYSGLRPNQPDQANTYAQISLGNVRTIKVTVMGEVKQAGTYNISSLSTVYNALHAAGGPSSNGTFRNIQVIRGQEIIRTFDIYDFLVDGNQQDNIRLRDQDIIKVDPYMNRIQLSGQTKRIGFFELTDGETLDHLLRYSGGFTDEAYTRRMVVRRNTETMRSVTDILYPEGGETELMNGDRVRVGEILDRFENRVEIEGAVFRPGEFELEPEMTLRDLILKAEGLREDAFTSRGVIYRLQDDLSLETVAFDVMEVLNTPDEHDIALERDDQVRIRSIFDMREEYTIRISGAVNNGGQFDYADNMTIEDAIYQANGFRDDAAEYRVEVARRVTGDGEQVKMDRVAEVFQFDVDGNLQFSTDDADFRLKPFDQIFVRVKPNYQQQQTVRIEGEVQFPGTYVIDRRNARLADLIEWAGGLSDYAYPEGASLERRIGEDILEEVEVLDTLESDRRATTSVGIRLEEALSRPGSSKNLILEPGDLLRIPKELETVRIEGEVLYPVSIRYEDRKSFQDYIDSAGGITEEAKRRRAYIVYANGEVDRTKRFLFIRNNPEVRPGATIYVPSKPERRELSTQERIQIWSSIVSMAAIVSTTIYQITN